MKVLRTLVGEDESREATANDEATAKKAREKKKKTYNNPLDLLVRVPLPLGVARRDLIAAREPRARRRLDLVVEVEAAQHPPELMDQRVFPLGERGR